ncbi:MAG: EVE domain-containing protein [Synechococcales cyanobacterium]
MNYWLLKTEPSVYSYGDLERDQRTVWDGVGNNLALKHIRQVQHGDLAFIYHTGDVRALIGVAAVVSEPYADPRLSDAKRQVFDLVPQYALIQPVTLATIKALPEFQDFVLVKNARLSVMPVSPEQWQRLHELGLHKLG